NDIRLITGLPVAPYIAAPSDILLNLTRIHDMHPRLSVAAKTLNESRPQAQFDRVMTLELSKVPSDSPAVEIVKLIIRHGLLDRARALITLPQLGFAQGAYREYHRLLHSPYGMMIVSGPTGSGKTTTLYASIHELDSQVRNIMTIEDPVEYMFDHINQSQINKLADISFANGLRAILRQDPDIILVGEIRDRETAEIAVQSALTGHLVLSSLHATDAVGALLRFTDMGIEGFLI